MPSILCFTQLSPGMKSRTCFARGVIASEINLSGIYSPKGAKSCFMYRESNSPSAPNKRLELRGPELLCSTAPISRGFCISLSNLSIP